MMYLLVIVSVCIYFLNIESQETTQKAAKIKKATPREKVIGKLGRMNLGIVDAKSSVTKLIEKIDKIPNVKNKKKVKEVLSRLKKRMNGAMKDIKAMLANM